MRLVLDTNVIVSGLLWTGVPSRLMDMIVASDHEIVLSGAILAELEDVLARPKLQPRLASLDLSVEDFLTKVSLLGRWIRPQSLGRVAPDPDDDAIIATAVSAGAKLLVTGDRALLTLAQVERVSIVGVHEAMTTLFPAG